MNTDTGVVLSAKELERLQINKATNEAQRWCPIDPAMLSETNRKQLESTGRTQISRNSSCPCGSGKRFKRCCYTGGR